MTVNLNSEQFVIRIDGLSEDVNIQQIILQHLFKDTQKPANILKLMEKLQKEVRLIHIVKYNKSLLILHIIYAQYNTHHV